MPHNYPYVGFRELSAWTLIRVTGWAVDNVIQGTPMLDIIVNAIRAIFHNVLHYRLITSLKFKVILRQEDQSNVPQCPGP